MSQSYTVAQETGTQEHNQEMHHNTVTENNHDVAHTATGETHQEQNIFMQILGNLPDHDALTIGAYKIVDLPKIYIDNGFHFYWNNKEVEQSGLYTITEHHGHKSVINNSTGQKPQIDLSVTNFVIFQWIAVIFLSVMFNRLHSKYKQNPDKAPSGFRNAIEATILYVRDEMIRPNIPIRKAADYLLPYFIALFFFVLFLNLTGLVPGGHTATGAIAVTASLALVSFFVINIVAMKESGVGAWFKHLLGGAPAWLAPIMIPIEIIGMFVKPFALTIRLFANMTAGHVVLFSLLGILFFFKTFLLSLAITPFSIFMYALELLVAFIQAFLFTTLTAIFVGLAIGHGHHEEHQESHNHAH